MYHLPRLQHTVKPGEAVNLNPQPLPPRWDDVAINPQPLPPRVQVGIIAILIG
jgi:hypothetical protein